MPGGRITKITGDLNQYAGVSVAGDTLVTARRQTRSGLWAMDADGSGARAIGADVGAELAPLAWVDGTRVLYAASLAGGTGLWLHGLATGAAQLNSGPFEHESSMCAIRVRGPNFTSAGWQAAEDDGSSVSAR